MINCKMPNLIWKEYPALQNAKLVKISQIAKSLILNLI